MEDQHKNPNELLVQGDLDVSDFDVSDVDVIQNLHNAGTRTVNPWYTNDAGRIAHGASQHEYFSQNLQGLQSRVASRDIFNTMSQLFPGSSIPMLPIAFPQFELSRYERMGVSFAHLTGLFPNPVPYVPLITPQSCEMLESGINRRAAAAFCAAAAADFMVIIDGWARVFGLEEGLSMEQCNLLSRRALAMLFPNHPTFGPNGLDSFRTSFAPYFLHLREDKERVPTPQPRGAPAIPSPFTRIPDSRAASSSRPRHGRNLNR